MTTLWQQHLLELSLDYYNQAVSSELEDPHDEHRAFSSYYAAALLGCKDAARHVAMAYDVGLGVEPSEWAAKFWKKQGGLSRVSL